LPTGFWIKSTLAVGQLLDVEVFINEISLVALNPTKMKTEILRGSNGHEVRINSQAWEVLISFVPLKIVHFAVLILVHLRLASNVVHNYHVVLSILGRHDVSSYQKFVKAVNCLSIHLLKSLIRDVVAGVVWGQ